MIDRISLSSQFIESSLIFWKFFCFTFLEKSLKSGTEFSWKFPNKIKLIFTKNLGSVPVLLTCARADFFYIFETWFLENEIATKVSSLFNSNLEFFRFFLGRFVLCCCWWQPLLLDSTTIKNPLLPQPPPVAPTSHPKMNNRSKSPLKDFLQT